MQRKYSRCANHVMILGVVWLGLSFHSFRAEYRPRVSAGHDDHRSAANNARSKERPAHDSGHRLPSDRRLRRLQDLAQSGPDQLTRSCWSIFGRWAIRPSWSTVPTRLIWSRTFRSASAAKRRSSQQKLKMYRIQAQERAAASFSLHEERDLAQGACPGRLRPDA